MVHANVDPSAPAPAPAARASGPGERLALGFTDYASLRAFVRDRYVPLPEEVMDAARGFAPGVSWARRGAPRFHRALKAVAGHVREGGTLLDVGAFPGTFARLARAGFGERLRVVACGMPVQGDFAGRLGAEGVPFSPCNLDPDVVAPADLPVGLPYPSGSVEVVTCMELVEHLYSLKTLFTEIHRVLAPGGIAYVTTNNVADRAGLLRAVRDQETNLDRDLDETTIWSSHENQWRGHVRFFSPGQISEAGARAGLATRHTGYFPSYEDPDVFVRDDRGPLGALRRWLRGDGSSPPWYPKLTLAAALHLGPRALSHRFDDHFEVTLQKPPTA